MTLTAPHDGRSGPPGLRAMQSGAGPIAREILATLPDWFGIPSATTDYVNVADASPTTVASIGGQDVGFLTVVRHSAHTAEIHVVGVRPEHHRSGIGRAMLLRVESELARDGVEYLQVKTLSSAHPDRGYAETRAFYAGVGFRILEEFPELWGSENPALQLIKALPAQLPLDAVLAQAATHIERLAPAAARDAAADAGALLIDIRSSDARARHGVIPGSIHIPRTVLEWRVAADSRWRNPHLGGTDQRLILVCDHGYSSVLAAAGLVQLGFHTADIIGGFEAWHRDGLPVTDDDSPPLAPDELPGFRGRQ